MKKITLLLSLLFVGFSTHAQFDWSSDPLQNGWVEYAGSNGEGTTESWTWFDDGPSSFMYITWEAASSGLLQCQDWLVSPAIPITNTTSGLSFSVEDQYAADYGSSLSVQVSTTGQTSGFTEVASFTEADISPSATLSVDLSNYEGSSVYIAFVWINNDGDRLYLYDLELVNINASPPSAATTPNPVDGSTVDLSTIDDGVNLFYVFTWSDGATGDAPTGYTFNLGTTSAVDLYSTTLGSSANDGFQLSGLNSEATYYWQIIPQNGGGAADSSTCPVWEFTTSANVLSNKDIQLSSINVSPNPVKDIVTINSPNGFDNIKVFNQLGQLVLKSNPDILNKNKLDLSVLNPGMYVLQINIENRSKTVKIIKE